MTWNYRIIDFGTHKALHEVHYESDQPVAYTAEPATFACDPDQHDIPGALRMALDDVTAKPVLAVAEIGSKGAGDDRHQ